MVNRGRRDVQTGLPLRVMDFLEALDQIIDAAIDEDVDMVLFAGDAYKGRTPAPTFQREWGRRIMRLSQDGIPSLLLVGNHDLSPTTGRAHALQEYETLQIPNVNVISRPSFLQPSDLWDLPLQVIALPWVSRSGLMASLELSGVLGDDVYEEMEKRLVTLVQGWLEQADRNLPVVLTAHASVQGAKYGGERSVMLGSDLVLSGSLVCDPRLDYVAMGHIHKPQDLNEGSNPPVVYPGSIERVDFGEVEDEKFFIIAYVEVGKTRIEWRKLRGREFADHFVRLDSGEGVQEKLIGVLPPAEDLADAIVRLTVEYPRDIETQIDESALRRYAEPAFEFHFVRRPHADARLRVPGDRTLSSLSPLELLELYWKTVNVEAQEAEALQAMAAELLVNEG